MWKRCKWLLLFQIMVLFALNDVDILAANQIVRKAEIIFPLPNDRLEGQVNIMGSAFIKPDGVFSYFHVEYTNDPNGEGWARLRRSGLAVEDDRLAIWDTRRLYNGQYYLRLTVVDNTANFARTEIIPVQVDNGPDAPLWPDPVEITRPTENEIVDRTVFIQGTASTEFLLEPRFRQKYPDVVNRGLPGTTFQYYKIEYSSAPEFSEWRLVEAVKTRQVPNGRLAIWDTTSIPNGNYAIRLQLVFEDGNFIETRTEVTVDNAPPPLKTIAKISRPEANADLISSTGIAGTATIDTRTATFDRYILDYGAGSTPTEWFIIREGTFPEVESSLGAWRITELSNGSYTLRLRVQNNQGQVEAEDQVRVFVAKPTKSVAIISRPADAGSIISDVSVKGTALLDTKEHQFGQFVLEYGEGDEPTEWQTVRTLNRPVQDVRLGIFEVQNLPNGLYSLRVRVEDSQGQTQVSDQIVITVDKPTETIAQISTPRAASTLIRDTTVKGIAVLDADTHQFGRAIVEYGQGETPTDWIRLNETISPVQQRKLSSFPLTSLDNGVYSLRLSVEDAEGQVQATDQVTVTVAKPIETIANIISPRAGGTLIRGATVRGIAVVDTNNHQFGRSILEYGEGEEPTDWKMLNETTYPVVSSKVGEFLVDELDNGIYSLRLSVEDVDGQIQITDKISVTVAKPTETLAEIRRPENATVTNQNVSIRGSAVVDTNNHQFGRSILEYGEGEEPETWLPFAENTFPLQPGKLGNFEVGNLPNGLYTIRLRVEDNQGETQAEDQIILTVDKPIETIIEPTTVKDGQTIDGSQLILGTATVDSRDYIFGRFTLEYGKGNRPLTWNLLNEITYPIEDGQLGVWDVRALGDGPYTLRFRIEDNVGEIVLEKTLNVILEKITETIGDITAPGDEILYVSLIDIEGTALLDSTDYEFGQFVVEYSTPDQPEDWIVITETQSGVDQALLAQWNVQALAPSTYTLRLRVEDVNEDTIIEDTQIIKVAYTEKDIIDITDPKVNKPVSGLVEINGSAIFAYGEQVFGQYQVQYDGGGFPFEWETIATSSTPIINSKLVDWDVSELPDGRYTLRLVVENKDGSVKIEDRVIVEVENP